MQTFSILNLFKRALDHFTKHFWLFVSLGALVVITTPKNEYPIAFSILGFFLSVLLSFVGAKMTLAVVDGKKVDLRKDWHKKDYFPTPHQYLKFFILLIAVGILIFCGFLVLIIPGIYIMTRLQLTTYAFIENKKSEVAESIASAWNLIKHRIFWKALLLMVIVVIGNFIGASLFGVGLLFTMPMTWIILALFYREVKEKEHTEMVVQPKEIEAKEVESTSEAK